LYKLKRLHDSEYAVMNWKLVNANGVGPF